MEVVTSQQLDLIKRTIAKDCDTTEFDYFMEVCRLYKLSPFKKQISCQVRNAKKGAKNPRQLVIIVQVDGFRAIALRAGNYMPSDKTPEYVYNEALKDPQENPYGIEGCTVYVKKMDSAGVWHNIPGYAEWSEFAPLEKKQKWKFNQETGKDEPSGEFYPAKLADNWMKMGKVMIAKCAEVQALRKGWPEDVGGLYAPEEMEAANLRELASSTIENAEAGRLLEKTRMGQLMVQYAPGAPLEAIPVGQMYDKLVSFYRDAEHAGQIDAFREINKLTLQQFYAIDKAAAHDAKRIAEERLQVLTQA